MYIQEYNVKTDVKLQGIYCGMNSELLEKIMKVSFRNYLGHNQLLEKQPAVLHRHVSQHQVSRPYLRKAT